jgi:hypothetical protein
VTNGVNVSTLDHGIVYMNCFLQLSCSKHSKCDRTEFDQSKAARLQGLGYRVSGRAADCTDNRKLDDMPGKCK